MNQRSLRYTDSKSDKFWEIQLVDASHTVRYGRYGTAGQTQTKEFDRDDAALKSFEKLVAEKLKKGYVDDGAAIVPPEPVAIERKKPTTEIPSVVIPENWRSMALMAIQAELVQDKKQLCELAAIDAIPEEYWGLLNVEVRAAIARQPFNPPQVYQKLAEDEHDAVREAIAANLYTPTDLLLKLSKDSVVEVRLAIAKNQVAPRVVIDDLAKDSYQKIRKATVSNQQEYDLTLRLIQNRQDRQNDTNKVIQRIDRLALVDENQLLDLSSGWDHSLRWYIKSHSTAHQSPERLTELFQEINCDQRLEDSEYRLLVSIAYNSNTPAPILEKLVNFNQTQGDALHGGPCYIMRNPVLEAIALNSSAPYDLLIRLAEQNNLFIAIALAFNKNTPQQILEIIGNSKDLVISTGNMYGVYSGQLEKERKQIFELFYLALAHNPNTPQEILERMISGKIKVTGSHYTPVSILKHGNQVISGRLTPAQVALHHRQQNCSQPYQDTSLKIDSKASTLSRYIKHLITHQPIIAHSNLWFDRYAIAQNPSTPKDLLETLAYDEHPYVQAAARSALGLEIITSSAIAATPETITLKTPAKKETDGIHFNCATTLQWLTSGISALPNLQPSKSPTWLSLADLPTISVDDHTLTADQITATLAALSLSTLDSPLPLIRDLKIHATSNSLDIFIWSLFKRWLIEGAPGKDKWAMYALGLLGSDHIALKLAPMIRVWPGESQHQRAVLGLECLRTIGTDTALMQINGIAQKVKFKGIKQRAQECMEAIAQGRGMTRAELEDRIVPDCELDAVGTRIFDFGDRQFRFVLGADLKPMLKDADNKIKADLPKPNSKDDPVKAEQAIADWKLFKKQLSEIVKLQPDRLEQAMITGRRWPVDDFMALLVQHPLMTHLVQRLIWGGYDAAGQLLETFRVTEDRTYADRHDATFNPTAAIAQIGIVHPLHLSAEVLSSWGEILSDYAIVAPFPQLGRSIYHLEPEEAAQTAITRFAAAKVPAVTLVGMLEKSGWARGIPQDAGVFYEHSKPFYGANITAIVQYYGVPVGYMEGWEDQSIESCIFLQGIYTPQMYPDHKQAIALGKIDPIVISEVLQDLTAIAAKAP